MTQTMTAIMKSEQVEAGFALPHFFKGKELTVTIQAFSPEQTESAASAPVSESFGMWKERDDMRDVESYLNNLRKGRFC